MKLLRTAGALLLAGLAATACTAGGGSGTEPAPATPSATAGPEPAATPTQGPKSQRPVVVGGAGSDGLTVRYQDRDGTTRTLRVEDFRR